MGLDLVDVALELERRFGVVLSEDEAGWLLCCTAGDLFNLVRSRIHRQPCFVPERIDRLVQRIECALDEAGAPRSRFALSWERRFPPDARTRLWRQLSEVLNCPLPPLEISGGSTALPESARNAWMLARWILENHPQSLRRAEATPEFVPRSGWRRVLTLCGLRGRWNGNPSPRSLSDAGQLTDAQIWEELVQLLSRVLRVDERQIHLNALLVRDLGVS